MERENVISSETLFEGRVVTLKLQKVSKHDGTETTREIIIHSPAVAMVARNEKNQILLVRQYREAIDRDLLEIPAGSIDPGEDPETAVRREMQEETGFIPGKLQKLSEFYAAPGYCTEYLYVYMATDLTPARLFAEDTDEITVVPTPVSEIPELLRSGKIRDSKSIIGLYAFLEYNTNKNNS